MTRARTVLTPTPPEAVLEHIEAGADLIVPLANGAPVAILDALEEHAAELTGVRIHQMHPLRTRRYMQGAFGDHLRHVSYFLSPVTRPHFARGTIELVPANFSEVPSLLRRLPNPWLAVPGAARSEPG